ncbi:MAG: hypothetical protein V1647_02555 [Pseudomonadota bacterium]
MKKLIGVLALTFIANTDFVFADATECKVGEAVTKQGNTIGVGYAFYCKDNPESQKILTKKLFEKTFGKDKVGLMAAYKNQTKQVPWNALPEKKKDLIGTASSSTDVTDTDVGTGLRNTRLLALYSESPDEEIYPAALSCYQSNDLKNKNRDVNADWFLPSAQELRLMYLVAINYSSRGFYYSLSHCSYNFIHDSRTGASIAMCQETMDVYWSSSESNLSGDDAWYIDIFDLGIVRSNGAKKDPMFIRCARAF